MLRRQPENFRAVVFWLWAPLRKKQQFLRPTSRSFTGEPYVTINGGVPGFEESDFSEISFEHYSELDGLGRCGTAFANVGKDLMPTEERGSIGQVKPSGWQTVQCDNVDGKYLYNRCHLIGYQLTAENANRGILITGTRYFNVEGMLPFENMAADYIRETGDHVLYRVTPVFEGDNLVATGVQMEACSVEDRGESLCFNVFVFNVQPGIVIDYADGTSGLSGDSTSSAPSGDSAGGSGDKGKFPDRRFITVRGSGITKRWQTRSIWLYFPVNRRRKTPGTGKRKTDERHEKARLRIFPEAGYFMSFYFFSSCSS